MNHADLPDPVKEEMQSMLEKSTMLKNRLAELEEMINKLHCIEAAKEKRDENI